MSGCDLEGVSSVAVEYSNRPVASARNIQFTASATFMR
jgi:hypothetical protein